MKRRTFIAAAGATALLAACSSKPAYVETYDHKLGNPDASVKVIEYFSLTCGHCARFHMNNLPLLKQDYIDMGLVELTLREVYFDPMAVKVSAVLREGDYLQGLDRHFAGFPDKMKPLMKEYEQIFNTVDGKKVNRLSRAAQHNAVAHNIEATPTFIFPDGGRVRGNNYPALVKAINNRIQ